jgi:hypothetical protein
MYTLYGLNTNLPLCVGRYLQNVIPEPNTSLVHLRWMDADWSSITIDALYANMLVFEEHQEYRRRPFQAIELCSLTAVRDDSSTTTVLQFARHEDPMWSCAKAVDRHRSSTSSILSLAFHDVVLSGPDPSLGFREAAQSFRDRYSISYIPSHMLDTNDWYDNAWYRVYFMKHWGHKIKDPEPVVTWDDLLRKRDYMIMISPESEVSLTMSSLSEYIRVQYMKKMKPAMRVRKMMKIVRRDLASCSNLELLSTFTERDLLMLGTSVVWAVMGPRLTLSQIESRLHESWPTVLRSLQIKCNVGLVDG